MWSTNGFGHLSSIDQSSYCDISFPEECWCDEIGKQLNMDDPEELAAAFFAEQAAKEKARITLPIDDWTENFSNDDDDDAKIDASRCQMSLSSITTTAATAWLVTTMPPAPTYRLANNENDDKADDDRGGTNKGIVGIILNSNETRLYNHRCPTQTEG